MSKNLSIPLLLLSACLLPHAAVAQASSPAPKPPFVAKTPENCSWVVRIEPKGKSPKQEQPAPGAGPMAAGGAGPQVAVLEEIRVAKAANLRRIIRKWSDGKAEESWYLGRFLLAEMPNQEGGREIVVFDTDPEFKGLVDTTLLTLGTLSGGEFARGDFPELDWIQASHFAGIGSPDANPCFIYRLAGAPPAKPGRREDLTMPESLKPKGSKKSGAKPAKPAEPASDSAASAPALSPEVLMEARIDCATKLPVSFEDIGHKRTYSFSMETPSLSLPPRFVDALEEYKAGLEAAKYRRMP